MKYKNITVDKYQIIQHIINKYAAMHSGVKPYLTYDKETKILDIGGISKPINFNTESIGAVPKGAYEVVAQAVRSKTNKGVIDKNGMTIYENTERVFNIVENKRQSVFDFIDSHQGSSHCACCGTNRDRINFFYIRRLDNNDEMYQVGSSCISEHFDTSYFDLMKDISDAVDSDDKALRSKIKDYNLIDYMALYMALSEDITNVANCHKQVATLLDDSSHISFDLIYKYLEQKDKIMKEIAEIAMFYTNYSGYVHDDILLDVKTIQSMHEMVAGNISVDPYYSKTHCVQVVKSYLSLLDRYEVDSRQFKVDLFKYNANLVQTQLLQWWRENAMAEYKIEFTLYKHLLQGQISNSDDPIIQILSLDIELDDSGKLLDEQKALADMQQLVSTINQIRTMHTSGGNLSKLMLDINGDGPVQSVKNRPKKNVRRVFAEAGCTVKHLIDLPNINLLNTTDGTCGINDKHGNKIYFYVSEGNLTYADKQHNIYKGKITLDSHTITTKSIGFDRNTLIKAVHIMEFLVMLSNGTNKDYKFVQFTNTNGNTYFNYSYRLSCGKLCGLLQFTIIHDSKSNAYIIESGPKFTFQSNLCGRRIGGSLNVTFTDRCWEHIKSGKLLIDDIFRSGNKKISGHYWFDGGTAPIQLTELDLRELTGIS